MLFLALVLAAVMLPCRQAINSSQIEKPHDLCPNCHKGQLADDLHIAAIKSHILAKLGLKAKPNVTSPVPKQVIMETLQRAEDERIRTEALLTTDIPTSPSSPRASSAITDDQEPDEYYARTSEILTFAEQGRRINGRPVLEFSYPQETERAITAGAELRVKSASIWLRVELQHHHHHRLLLATHDKNITLWLFRVKGPPNITVLSGADFEKYTEYAASLSVSLSSVGWLHFDVTSKIREWYARVNSPGREKLRLLFECTGCGDLVEPLLFTSGIGGSVNSNARPFLVVHTDPNLTRRVRRRAVDCTGALPGQCCKQRFYVSFQKLGWDDWIIAPGGYYANYCRGDCSGPRTPDTFYTYYTHVIEELRKVNGMSGIQPCCAPLKFSSMSLIYFGPDSNIIKRDLPKMVVDECGCP